MEKLKVTWKATLIIWWSYVWRVMLFGAILGIILGAIGGFVVAIIGKPNLAGMTGAILGYIGSIPVSIWALKKILDKKYKHFSVALISKENE